MRFRSKFVAAVLLSAAVAFAADRTPQQIFADIAQVDQQIKMFCMPSQLLNPKYRDSVRPTLKPMLDQRQKLYDEWKRVQPTPAGNRDFFVLRNNAELAYLGEADAEAELKRQAASNDPNEKSLGTLGLAIRDWCNANGKADEQSAILDKLQPMTTERPTDDNVAHTLIMLQNENPASPELITRLTDLVCTLKSPSALAFKAKPNQLGKPLKIVSTTVAGKPLDLEKFKGKVVMIDFWATWCPPCMAELPKVVETYKKYHDEGLELVGISPDHNRQEFVAWLKQHPEVAWPQLCAGIAAWHPLTKQFGVDSIPRVYLIDRAGNLRTMEARGQTDELIPQLLAEKTDAASAQPTAGRAPLAAAVGAAK